MYSFLHRLTIVFIVFSSFVYILARFNLIASLKRKFSSVIDADHSEFYWYYSVGLVAGEAFPRLFNDSDAWAEQTSIIFSWSENFNNWTNMDRTIQASCSAWLKMKLLMSSSLVRMLTCATNLSSGSTGSQVEICAYTWSECRRCRMLNISFPLNQIENFDPFWHF